MATLLGSILIGAGFNAFVVSGYATREVTSNNQTRVNCPAIPKNEKPIILEEGLEESEEEDESDFISSKYKLKDPIDLNSQFLVQVEQDSLDKIRNLKLVEEELERKRLEEEEKLSIDDLEGKRIHSWVLVLKSDETFFIEPTTGFRHELNDPIYFGIESLWNHENYFVNRQEKIIQSIPEIEWYLLDRNKFERLLLIESDFPENQGLEIKTTMDMPISWVNQLTISGKEFEERFPNAEKRIDFKRAVHEKFAVYKNVDGLVERISTFKTLDYQDPQQEKWEYFRNRKDLLELRKTVFGKNVIEEHFGKGRADSIRSILKSADDKVVIKYEFFATSSLRALELDDLSVREFFNKREDL